MSQRDWGRARKMFECGAPIANIATRFALSCSAVAHAARREGWVNAVEGGETGQIEPVGDDSRADENLLSGRSRTKPGVTDAQRDALAQQTLKRFVRDKNKPEELETLRYNLIVARVMSGMTAVEAAEKFGYANSTQISLIESGQRKIPDDYQFIRRASQVYAVSCDFLFGLSPHMEYDGRAAHQHALMRGTESILGGIAAQFATVMIEFTNQTQPVPEDFMRVCDASQEVETALAAARRHGLDEVRGSSALIANIERLSNAIGPLRQKVTRYCAIDSYFDELRAGRMPPIAYLTERYAPDAR
ncbi:helix-turn-helix transcriptional regulator [Paraburkholderia sp. WP4_3_2]|nr:helix-turn-helix transcriptional regulator [Paraburkholderia sp. WP4_3_2]MBB3255453.1 transcriptional regulator with XRE-family HTH domain [Paraburkholderia sp. WP4_3_2]